jgi:hypothetical protein
LRYCVSKTIDQHTNILTQHPNRYRKFVPKNHVSTVQWISNTLEEFGLEVHLQNFSVTDPVDGAVRTSTNVYGVLPAWRSDASESLLLHAPRHAGSVNVALGLAGEEFVQTASGRHAPVGQLRVSAVSSSLPTRSSTQIHPISKICHRNGIVYHHRFCICAPPMPPARLIYYQWECAMCRHLERRSHRLSNIACLR